MGKLLVGKSLKDTDVLWRYMTLDKFVDLIASKTLFFAPLAWYGKTDPFEGYLPAVCMEAMAAPAKKYREEHIAILEKIAATLPEDAAPNVAKLRDKIEAQLPTMREIYKNLASCLMVNCWYGNAHESEGMWGLYSKSGVAIKTSVGALKAAIGNGNEDVTISIGSVKYIDFSDPSLKPSDCLSEDGFLIGMLKRIAYAHEHEVRMCIARERKNSPLEMLEPAPMRVSADLDKLIEAVVISPFVGETVNSSVRAICKWGGISEAIVSKSMLLDHCEYLLDAYQ